MTDDQKAAIRAADELLNDECLPTYSKLKSALSHAERVISITFAFTDEGVAITREEARALMQRLRNLDA